MVHLLSASYCGRDKRLQQFNTLGSIISFATSSTYLPSAGQ